MNEPHDLEREREFQDYLRHRRAPFPRPTDADVEPPPELDRIVLGKARAAIVADAPGLLRPKNLWALPIGLAATLVLAFAVVLNVGPTRVTPPVGAVVAVPAARETEESPAARETEDSPAARESDGSPAESAALPETREAEDFSAGTVADSTDTAASSSAPASEPSGPAASESSAARPVAPSAHAKPERREQAAPRPVFAEPPRSQAPALAAPATGASLPAIAADQDLIESYVAQKAHQEANYPTSETPSSETVAKSAGADGSTEHRARQPVFGAASRTAVSSARGSADQAASAMAVTPARDPAAWLEEIEALRRAGRTADADRELAAFRKAFPTYERDAKAATPDQ